MVRDAGHASEEHIFHQGDQKTRGGSFLKKKKNLNNNNNLANFAITHVLCVDFQAIYELYRGEQDLIEDLQLARKVI